jgi:hypothetical protein
MRGDRSPLPAELHLAAALGCIAWTSWTRNAFAADSAPSQSIAPIATPTEAQESGCQPRAPSGRLAQNSVFIEGLGPAILYSTNYERIVIENVAAARVGISYVAMGASSATAGGTVSARASLFALPITASYLGLRSGVHVLELGGGATLINTSGSLELFGKTISGSKTRGMAEAIVGYRMHPVDGSGVQIRVGATVLFGDGLSLSKLADPDTFGVLPWPYLSLGGSF